MLSATMEEFVFISSLNSQNELRLIAKHGALFNKSTITRMLSVSAVAADTVTSSLGYGTIA